MLAVLLALAVAISYLLYITLQYHRIDDDLSLDIYGQPSGTIMQTGAPYTALVWNLSGCVSTPSFASVWEGGTMSRAGKDACSRNERAIITRLQEEAKDFYLLQEVDTKSTRSRRMDEITDLQNAMQGWESVSAQHVHTAWLYWPVRNPSGRLQSSLMLFSDSPMEEARRERLPVAGTYPDQFIEEDACFVHGVVPVAGGKLLHLVTFKLSGAERARQWEALCAFFATITARGDYLLAGGDCGQLVAPSPLPSKEAAPSWATALDLSALPQGIALVSPTDSPTRRSGSRPWRKGTSWTGVTDAVIVSSNVHAEVTASDTGFALSSHESLAVSFTLE